ncbi:MAG: NADH-quinone oxidoreductase subunit N [Verrucomicrobiales bacterium]|nr:NADH-quinone oxidoreductase subunit N [Verrucomicrobiales bacterium]
MNASLLGPELVIVGLGLALLLLDLMVPPERRRWLGCVAAATVFALCTYFIAQSGRTGEVQTAFGGMYVLDGLAVYFKALFLLAGGVVLLLAVDWTDHAGHAVTEYFVLILFALAGMMLCASAHDFATLYVSLELVTVTFYVLTSYQRDHVASLEAGVKYLILGALSSAFLVYGIALCYGAAGTMSFTELASQSPALAGSKLFQLGMLLVLGGLAFKVALFPFQVWAPDVYEGSPAPTTAFLAVGSKAAGLVLMVRLFGSVLPDLTLKWEPLLMVISGVSILYGSLCAIPQRSLKRLMGYSSIANGGLLMMGLAAASKAGSAAILFYLAGYLFTVVCAFVVASVVVQRLGTDDLTALAGLHRRSPMLAASLTLSMVSLAGVPPLAGFFGKFVLIRALVEQGASFPGWYVLIAVALAGVVISFSYYFRVIKAIYWSGETAEAPPLVLSPLVQAALVLCLAGMLALGILPSFVWEAAVAAVAGLRL